MVFAVCPRFLRLDLKGSPHVLLDVSFNPFLLIVVPVILDLPLGKVLPNLFLHIAHVEARAADGDCRERKVCHGARCFLQSCHHLLQGIKLIILLGHDSSFYYLVVLPLTPSVPSEDSGNGQEDENEKRPQQSI